MKKKTISGWAIIATWSDGTEETITKLMMILQVMLILF